MTTKELINQYVTAHADNRWMDASELEALLTEFAEKLKEQMMKDAVTGLIADNFLDVIKLRRSLPGDKYKAFQSVKVIIVKSEIC